jgi:hypothetical protein
LISIVKGGCSDWIFFVPFLAGAENWGNGRRPSSSSSENWLICIIPVAVAGAAVQTGRQAARQASGRAGGQGQLVFIDDNNGNDLKKCPLTLHWPSAARPPCLARSASSSFSPKPGNNSFYAAAAAAAAASSKSRFASFVENRTDVRARSRIEYSNFFHKSNVKDFCFRKTIFLSFLIIARCHLPPPPLTTMAEAERENAEF